VITARTASVRIENIENVVARVKAYASTGVDAVFVTGLKKLDHLDAIHAAIRVPIILGTAPNLTREEVEARGVRFHLQGHPAVAAVVKALRDTYAHLYAGGAPADLKSRIATPEEMERLMGNDTYRKWQREYLR